MLRCLLAVALLVAASCVPVSAGEPVMKADPAYGVRYAQEKVVTLPQDQETPYLTLFGDRNDPRFFAMLKWFDANETLASIKNQTHFNVIYSDQPMYRERYATTVSALPCVRLQAFDEDQPVAEYSGVNVPMTAEALAKGLKKIPGGIASRATLRQALIDSGKALEEFFTEAERTGKIKGSKLGPVGFLGYALAHEGHHRGQILLHLKIAKKPLDRATSYTLWYWSKT